MSVLRLNCGKCGLHVTCVRTGLGGVMSVDPDMFASMCEAATAVRMRGDVVSALDLRCPNLAALDFIADNDAGRGAQEERAPRSLG